MKAYTLFLLLLTSVTLSVRGYADTPLSPSVEDQKSFSTSTPRLWLGTKNIGFGVNHTCADSTVLSSLNVGLLARVDSLRGVQLGVFRALATDVRGLNVAGLFAACREMRGVQISAIANVTTNTMQGLQAATVFNLANETRGVQIGALSNITLHDLDGVQASVVSNVSMGMRRGLQISTLCNVCAAPMRGMQLAMFNYADSMAGVQTGLINVSSGNERGWQIGLLNYTTSDRSHRLGLINVSPATVTQVMLFGGNDARFNLGVRFRNKVYYNIVGVSSQFANLNRKFSGGLFYRIGLYHCFNPKWSISADMGYFHIQSREQGTLDDDRSLYSLQGRVNLDFALNKRFGFFLSGGYGFTRFYRHNERFNDKPLVEAGFTFSLRKRKGGEL